MSTKKEKNPAAVALGRLGGKKSKGKPKPPGTMNERVKQRWEQFRTGMAAAGFSPNRTRAEKIAAVSTALKVTPGAHPKQLANSLFISVQLVRAVIRNGQPSPNAIVRAAYAAEDARRELHDLPPVRYQNVMGFAKAGLPLTRATVETWLATRGTFGAVDREIDIILRYQKVARHLVPSQG